MRLEALFEQPHALPAIPQVVHELIDSFNNEGVSVDQVARRLSADPVLSARVLRLANSAYYHASGSIGTMNDALAMLGFVTVRTLVISSGLTGGYTAMPGIDLKSFWRYSLHTAAVGSWLARKTGSNPDLTFTVCLMHAIGELVMHAGMPEQMLQLDRLVTPIDARRLHLERVSFGYTYADVGAQLATRWRFPATFSGSIRHFPDPVAGKEFNPVAALLHVAAWRARAEHGGLNEKELAATLPTAVLQTLKLRPDVVLVAMPPMSKLVEGLDLLVE
jgi:HD-like signal output (HDOD) protein